MHIDHVVQRRAVRRLLPDFAGQGVTGDDLLLRRAQGTPAARTSLAVSSTTRPPRVTCRVARSISRSPVPRRRGALMRPRRMTARMRANSSGNANGLTR